MRVKIVAPNGSLIDPEVRLNDVVDVAATAPANGQILRYNADTKCWECVTDVAASGQYYDRGDPSSVDFSKADFATDGDWHVLNLSNIIPVGTTLVHLRVYAYTSSVPSWIFFSKNGSVNRTNRAAIAVRHGANAEYYESVWVACDSDRKIEYMMSNYNWGALDVLVRGWMK